MKNNTFSIYQPKRECLMKYIRRQLFDENIIPNFSDYEHVCTIAIDEKTNSPEKIFEKLSLDYPSDFEGHSLSITDVIAICDEFGNKKTYFAGRVGFEKIVGFY